MTNGMTTKTIVGYLYRNEHYCPAHIVDAVHATPTQDERDAPEETLDSIAIVSGWDRSRPASFSQRDFPHTITSGQLDEPASLCETCRTEIR